MSREERQEVALETLNAILTLEYHDKNWLAQTSSNPKRWNEQKRELIRWALDS